MQDCLSAPTAPGTWLLPVLMNYSMTFVELTCPTVINAQIVPPSLVKTSRFFSLVRLVTSHVAHNRVAGANTVSTWQPISSTDMRRSEKFKSLLGHSEKLLRAGLVLVQWTIKTRLAAITLLQHKCKKSLLQSTVKTTTDLSYISTKSSYVGLRRLHPLHAQCPKEERIKEIHHMMISMKVNPAIVLLSEVVMQHF